MSWMLGSFCPKQALIRHPAHNSKMALRRTFGSLLSSGLLPPCRSFSSQFTKAAQANLPAVMQGLPERVKIVEVGPRDGLQNEREIVKTCGLLQLVGACWIL